MTTKQLPLVTNTLMVNLSLEATKGSPTHFEIESIISSHFSHKMFHGTSAPCVNKLSILRNILVNLALVQTQGFELLVFPNGKRNFTKSRYTPAFYTSRLVKVVMDEMVRMNVIAVLPSSGKPIRIPSNLGGNNTVSVIQATRLQLLLSHEFSEVTSKSISAPKAEIVILKGLKTDGIYSEDKVNYSDRSDIGRAALILRADLRVINNHLVNHELTYTGSKKAVRSNTSYHRVFNNGSLQYGGRYHGQFMQTLPKTERSLLRIDGERISNVDYSALQYDLLRWKDGATTSLEGDPFIIKGYEELRSCFKKLSYALLNAKSLLNQAPEGFKELLEEAGWTRSYTDFKKLLLNSIPLIAKYAGTSLGHELTNTESQIMSKALVYLMATHKCGFVIMHDGLLVPSSKAAGTHAVLMRAFNEHMGYFPSTKTTQH